MTHWSASSDGASFFLSNNTENNKYFVAPHLKHKYVVAVFKWLTQLLFYVCNILPMTSSAYL